jgi:transcriptional regulator with XRE-family HTH domain/tetratricopeptide (TPR) repeat protein
MNVTGTHDTRLSLETWNEPEMKRALAARDISSVYRLLRRVGISQRHIAALTGQSQSEISEILKGRQVMAYDVLVRIAGGLGIPRGYMGLAYDPATATSMVGAADDANAAKKKAEEAESVKRRNLLEHGSAMLFGTTVLAVDRRQWSPTPAQTPMPSQIGMTDVKQVEATTRALRALDYEFGGGTCRDAVLAQLSWAQRLLGTSAKEEVRLRLFRSLGDLHNLAGWASFDVGLQESARSHYATALEFAQRSGDASLMSNIMYRIGRGYMHDRDPNEAIKWLQMGQLAAQNSGSEQAVAVLCANEAWSYAMLGDEAMAQKLLDRAQSELARANLDDVPSWAKFYDNTEMRAITGTVHTELAAFDKPRHAALAIPVLRETVASYDNSMARTGAFNLTTLAVSHLRQGDVTEGIQVGRKALITASKVKSTRVADRLKPLQSELAKWPTKSDARELCHLIRARRSVSV